LTLACLHDARPISVIGRYLAVVWTDFFQAFVMVGGMLGILIMGLIHVGGISGLNAALGQVDSSYLSIWGKGFEFYGQWGVIIGALLIYSIRYMGLPIVVVIHMLMSRTKIVKFQTLWL